MRPRSVLRIIRSADSVIVACPDVAIDGSITCTSAPAVLRVQGARCTSHGMT